MRLFELFDDQDSFRSDGEIRKCIEHSKNYEGENPADSKTLLFFKTSKQRTYLVATDSRLYCILDDARKESPHINWSMPKNSLIENGKLIIAIQTRNKTQNTGLVDISNSHKNWLFTKELFSSVGIEERIGDFLLNAMAN
jgi:hypothetical protein